MNVLDWIYKLDYFSAFGIFFAENILIAFVSIQLGNLVVKRFAPDKKLLPDRMEITLLSSTVFLNTMTNLAGFWLWKNNLIEIRQDESVFTFLLDFFSMLLIMDFLMYVLHRLAHIPFIFRWLHATHHTFKNPRPIDLFALNPLEDIAFGMLWLAFLAFHSSGWMAMTVYLTMNVTFGIIGHLGIETVPSSKRSSWWYQLFCFSAFHHRHHAEEDCNFGFYTTLWDRLFRTLKLNLT